MDDPTEMFRLGKVVIAELKKQRPGMKHFAKFQTTVKVIGFDDKNLRSNIVYVIVTTINSEA